MEKITGTVSKCMHPMGAQNKRLISNTANHNVHYHFLKVFVQGLYHRRSSNLYFKAFMILHPVHNFSSNSSLC